MIFDSLEFSETLQQHGFSKEQADALAREQKKLISETLVTKTYLDKKTLELKLWIAGSYSFAILATTLIVKFVK